MVNLGTCPFVPPYRAFRESLLGENGPTLNHLSKELFQGATRHADTTHDRLEHSLQRLQLPRHNLHPLLLHHHHRVPDLATPFRRPTPTASLVTGEVGPPTQYYFAVLHDADAVFLRVAFDVSGHAAEYVS